MKKDSEVSANTVYTIIFLIFLAIITIIWASNNLDAIGKTTYTNSFTIVLLIVLYFANRFMSATKKKSRKGK